MRIAKLLFFLFVTLESSAQVKQGHKYVDLGLPSGNLWATANIGAQSKDASGSFYARGGNLN